MRKKDGFTLVELIVVIAILAILAGVAIPAYSGYIEKSSKASDLVLLGAMNVAFNAALYDNSINPNSVVDAEPTISEDKCITGVTIYNQVGSGLMKTTIDFSSLVAGTSVSDAGHHMPILRMRAKTSFSDDVNGSFLHYFGDNANTKLKYLEQEGGDEGKTIIYQDGEFIAKEDAGEKRVVTVGDKKYTYTEAQVEAYRNSNYSKVRPSELTGSVDSLAAALGDNKTGLAALANSSTFKAKLVELGVIDADTEITAAILSSNSALAKEIANASVLYVAQSASTMNPDSVYEAFKNGTISDLVSGTGVDASFVTAAIQYGLLTAFVNTEDGAAYKTDFMADSAAVRGLTDVTNLFNKYTNDKGTGTYYDYEAYVNSDAAANDIKGFLSALNVINDNSGNFDLSSIYSDPAILQAVESILGTP